MKRFFVGFLILLASTSWAQKPAQPVVSLPTDSVTRTARRPDAATWEELRTDREFRYGQDVTPPVTPWDRFWRRVQAWFLRWLQPENQRARNWLTGLVVAVVLGFALYKFLQMERRGFFTRRGTDIALPYDVLTEDIHAISFDEAIATAVQNRDYRLAVRLYYLKTLKELSDRNLIRWQLDKTNRTYAQELAKTSLQAEFEHLTSRFEYVWYGNFPVNEPQFVALRTEFDTFRQALPTTASVS
jgi:hypothetical protein